MAQQSTKLEVAQQGGSWIVREQGIGRLTSHDSKSAAASAARAVAALHTPSELVIRNADGSVDREEAFPRRG